MTCPGCGATLPPPKTKPRTWCGRKCRDAEYRRQATAARALEKARREEAANRPPPIHWQLLSNAPGPDKKTKPPIVAVDREARRYRPETVVDFRSPNLNGGRRLARKGAK